MAYVLESLGVSEPEEQMYRELLARPELRIDELAKNVRVEIKDARKTLRALEEKGLVSRIPERRPRFVPTPPEFALETLLARREEELQRARIEAEQLLQQVRAKDRSTETPRPVELVGGFEPTRQRWLQVQRTARHEVRILDRPPYFMTPGEPNQEELVLLGKGIRYRVLYDESSFDVPGKLDAVRACVNAGEEARVAQGIPMKLVAADDKIAITYTHGGDEHVRDGLLIYPSSLLDGLLNMFEILWSRSVALAPETMPPKGDAEAEVDKELVAFLAVGVSDEAIAHRLQISVRTVRRRIAELMTRLDAQTRFQAGYLVSQERLLISRSGVASTDLD